ncbi:metal ABC transporter ATP-binding protein [Nocardioides sp. C4-1]|uniref:metal ABC transporter ATP-binding protein n=1 Tax=Nocardioides sp. C4-1 TaxID=3151851 RepID=UPI0032644471
MTTAGPSRPVLSLRQATLRLGGRELWSGLDLDVEPGTFVTVLGPNGSGKSSLLKVVLGLRELTAGSASVAGRAVRRGDRRVGYVPQHSGFDADTPVRGRDLVQLGVDGHRWGLPSWGRSSVVQDRLRQVGADHLADVRLGRMSGGEQQRVRIAQALATDPDVLLCDEPLLSLDPRHQARVVDLLDRRRRDHGTAVVFVTHEINPVLGATDLVLYLMDGRFVLGTPDEVLRSEVLSSLYGTRVEVVRRRDRVAVLADEAVGF